MIREKKKSRTRKDVKECRGAMWASAWSTKGYVKEWSSSRQVSSRGRQQRSDEVKINLTMEMIVTCKEKQQCCVSLDGCVA